MAGILYPAPSPAQQAAAPVAAPAPVPTPDIVSVVLHTTLGDVVVAVDEGRAPITAKNFLRYVDEKRLDSTTIYRAVKIGEDGSYGLVQGGLRNDPKRVLPPIAHESPKATGLSHVDGAVSMARENPGTATADFFFVVGDLVSLDGTADGVDPGYAVFGRVVSGMDIVKSVLDLPRSADAGSPAMKGQMLAEPVKIVAVRRVE